MTDCSTCGASLQIDDAFCTHCGTPAEPSEAKATYVDPTLADESDLEKIQAALQEALQPKIRLLRVLSRGGMGIVFLGRDLLLKRQVAVKVLAPDLAQNPKLVARFAREAESMARISHPNVVKIYDVGSLSYASTCFFVMQFVEGETLEEAFPANRPAPASRVKRIAGEIAAALAATHDFGIVHRDIKASNVMLDRSTGHVVILDFGISASPIQTAQRDADRLTVDGVPIGTPLYMSPEQALGHSVSDRSDVYSLGVLMYRLLAGLTPFAGRSPIEILVAHSRDEPQSMRSVRPDLDPKFARLVDVCLAKHPENRPSAKSIARYLNAVPVKITEWPPPGLEKLHRVGIKLMNSSALYAGALVLFFLLLAHPPTLSSQSWHLGERSGFWQIVLGNNPLPELLPQIENVPEANASAGNLTARTLIEGANFADTGLIWHFVRDLCVWFLVLTIPLLVYHAMKLTRHLRAGLHLGYPWRVVTSTAFDRHIDSADLLNGTGVHALADGPERQRTLLHRQRRELLRVIIIGSSILGPVLWLYGWPGGWSSGSIGPIPNAELLAILAVPFLGVLGLIVTAAPEMLSRIRLRNQDATPSPSISPKELASDWMADSPPPRAISTKYQNVFKYAPTALIILVSLGITYLALIVSLATWAAYWSIGEGRNAAIQWASSFAARDRAYGSWTSVHELLKQQAGVDATLGVTGDSILATQVAELLHSPGPEDIRVRPPRTLARQSNGEFLSLWISPADPWVDTADTVSSEERRRRRGNVDTAWSILPNALPDSVRELLVMDTLTGSKILWDQLGHAQLLPQLWHLKLELPEATSPRDLPFFLHPAKIDELRALQSARAVLALERRDYRQARTILSETARIGLQVMQNPYPPEAWHAATTQLLRIVRDMSREIAILSDDDELLHSSTEFETQVDAWIQGPRRLFSHHVSTILMSDPVNMVGFGFIADERTSTEIKWSLVADIADGFCSNTRELLFGVSSNRLQWLDRVRPQPGDAALQRWAGFVRSWAEMLVETPERIRPYRDRWRGEFGVAAMLRPLGWVGLSGLRNRLAYCSGRFGVLGRRTVLDALGTS